MFKKEKMDRKSNNKQTVFSEELLQEIFADVGQYNLFSETLPQKETPQKGESLLLHF